MKKAVLVSPFLALVASTMFLYLNSAFNTPVGDIVRPLLVLLGILSVMEWSIYRLTHDWEMASALLVIVVVGFFSRSDYATAIFVSILAITALLWLVYTCFRKKLKLFKILEALNLMWLSIIFWCGFRLYSGLTAIPPSYFENLPDKNNAYPLDPAASNRPDIYYIVVDGYGRADTLAELYGYDNSPFLEQLNEHGFILPGHSHSNYTRTVLSIASTLNMDYIDSFAPGLNKTNYWWLMSPWIDDNGVRTSLEKIGYTSIAISTGLGITDNHGTDLFLIAHPIVLNEFERDWLASTPLKVGQPLIETMLPVATYDSHRMIQLYNFTALSTVPEISGPKFVFAHIILPHPPFVFMADGTPVDLNDGFTLFDANDYPGSMFQYREGYIAQLQFLNSRLESTVDAILQGSDQPPVIILQADHGPGMLTDFSSSANSCLRERFSTFSAYYLPGVDRRLIPDDITSVNLFRIIFNEYFDAQLPLLENKSYFSKHANAIYSLEDVTDLLDRKDNCELPLDD